MIWTIKTQIMVKKKKSPGAQSDVFFFLFFYPPIRPKHKDVQFTRLYIKEKQWILTFENLGPLNFFINQLIVSAVPYNIKKACVFTPAKSENTHSKKPWTIRITRFSFWGYRGVKTFLINMSMCNRDSETVFLFRCQGGCFCLKTGVKCIYNRTVEVHQTKKKILWTKSVC